MKRTNLHKLLALLLALTLALAGCGSPGATPGGAESASGETAGDASPAGDSSAGDPVELVVFAAASMTETLSQLAETYEAGHPEVTLTFNFDSSGTLKTQIEEGADCDLFVSAGQLQMNQLDQADTTGDNTDGLDFVRSDSRVDLLKNEVVLCVPDPDAAGAVTSFEDLADRLASGDILLAMGNSDVPVGQYTQKILDYYGLDEEALAAEGCITYGTNVKEVTTQVKEASVDCGVIYCTDAYSDGLAVVDAATDEMCGQVIYPAAVMKHSAHPAEAQAFLDYLGTQEAMDVFAAVGFSPAQ